MWALSSLFQVKITPFPLDLEKTLMQNYVFKEWFLEQDVTFFASEDVFKKEYIEHFNNLS